MTKLITFTRNLAATNGEGGEVHGAERSSASVEGVAALGWRGRTKLVACNGCSTLLLVEERTTVTTSASTTTEKATNAATTAEEATTTATEHQQM